MRNRFPFYHTSSPLSTFHSGKVSLRLLILHFEPPLRYRFIIGYRLQLHFTAMHSVYRNLPRGHIRLLTVHPGNETTALSGTLHSTPLEEAPQFEAVSYAWGTGSFTETLNIISNPGTVFTSGEHEVSGAGHITRNVTSLLRCLRRRSETRILWVDAICINQANISERNDQVQQRRKIYSRARVVVIWLGPAIEGDGSGQAIAFLNQMGQNQQRRNNTISDGLVQDDDSAFSQD